jgi:hypothetical protein
MEVVMFVAYGDGQSIVVVDYEALVKAYGLYKKGFVSRAGNILSEARAGVFYAPGEMPPEVWVEEEGFDNLPFFPGRAVLVLGSGLSEEEEKEVMPVGVATWKLHPLILVDQELLGLKAC